VEITVEDVKWPSVVWDDEGEREEGLHLGTVIKSLMDNSGLGYKGKGFTDMELTAEIGLLWERVLGRVMGDKYAQRPGQIQSDGIWMSLDGIGPDPLGEVPLVVEEYKAAWKSTKQSPVDNFYYMCQVKSYCRAIETNVAVMRIFHVMGNYKGSGPIYRVARLVFTEWELDQNWKMILREKERRGL
jgi:hypothetical protein